MTCKKWICSTYYLKITYSFTSGGFPCDRSVSTNGIQINTKPNWKNKQLNKFIRQINTINININKEYKESIDLFCKFMYSAIENK